MAKIAATATFSQFLIRSCSGLANRRLLLQHPPSVHFKVRTFVRSDPYSMGKVLTVVIRTANSSGELFPMQTSGKAAFSHQHVRYHWDSHGSPTAIMASKLLGSPQDKVSDDIQSWASLRSSGASWRHQRAVQKRPVYCRISYLLTIIWDSGTKSIYLN
jgi:hypothetical protein